MEAYVLHALVQRLWATSWAPLVEPPWQFAHPEPGSRTWPPAQGCVPGQPAVQIPPAQLGSNQGPQTFSRPGPSAEAWPQPRAREGSLYLDQPAQKSHPVTAFLLPDALEEHRRRTWALAPIYQAGIPCLAPTLRVGIMLEMARILASHLVRHVTDLTSLRRDRSTPSSHQASDFPESEATAALRALTALSLAQQPQGGLLDDQSQVHPGVGRAQFTGMVPISSTRSVQAMIQ